MIVQKSVYDFLCVSISNSIRWQRCLKNIISNQRHLTKIYFNLIQRLFYVLSAICFCLTFVRTRSRCYLINVMCIYYIVYLLSVCCFSLYGWQTKQKSDRKQNLISIVRICWFIIGEFDSSVVVGVFLFSPPRLPKKNPLVIFFYCTNQKLLENCLE